MLDSCRWIALGYNVPIEPSRNRVYVWRKLKEFGAEYFRPGVAILANTKDLSLIHILGSWLSGLWQ